ncbi:hypothetical protein N8Y93_03745, partial [Litorivicinus sp.]|nr:hypothetical protein [Litorivicinus sp.]
DTVLFDTGGKFASIDIPSGNCDISQSESGQFLKSFLEERAKSAGLGSEMPEVEVIFAPCSGFIEYPWGWIGSMNQDAKGLSQSMLNKYIQNNLGGLIADIEGKIYSKESINSFEQATGFKIEALETGVPITLISNDQHHLSSFSQTVEAEGQQIKELVLTSSMVRNGRIIYMYAYELQNQPDSIMRLMNGLRSSASSLIVR